MSEVELASFVDAEEPAGTAMSSDPILAPGLYLVGTPIGNLEDITLRALRVLRSVDRIACEDTRQTQKLLNHFGIRRPLVSYHLHNEQERAEELIHALQAGERVAVVSDAGMPGIADPGETLVRAALKADISVFPVPGANAALSALIASGLPSAQFRFHGFLPAKEGQRRTKLEEVRTQMTSGADGGATQIFYESPHRILETFSDVVAVFGPEQNVVLGRELTKLHEEFVRGPAAALRAGLQARPSLRGEMVLLLDGRVTPGAAQAAPGAKELRLAEEVALAMREGLSEKDALKRVAKARGLGKSEAYREWQRGRKH